MKLIEKDLIDHIFFDLAKTLRKKNRSRNLSCEIVVVGGASILLNYGFRLSTEDIDCYDVNDVLMNEVVEDIKNKYDLPGDWINTSFVNTASFSPKIIQYSSFYKSYCNGVLTIRTIKDEYLLAMKMVSARRYKADYSDIVGIIHYNKANGTPITIEKIHKAIMDLYGSLDVIKKEVMDFVIRRINDDKDVYTSVRNIEINNRVLLKEMIEEKGHVDRDPLEEEMEDID